MPVVGRVGSSKAKAIELAGLDPFEPDVPDVARPVSCRIENDAPGRRGVFGAVEEVETDARRVPAEDREVDTVGSQVGAERQRSARSDRLNLAQREQTLQLVKLLVAERLSHHDRDDRQLAYQMPRPWIVSCNSRP